MSRCNSAASRCGPTARSARGALAGQLVAVVLLPLALGACAPDAWKPNPNFSAFLNNVERACGTTRLGELTISQLMSPGSAMYSAYFVDMTSRYDLNRISVEDYVLGISSTFNTVRDSAGIRCVVAQKSPPQ